MANEFNLSEKIWLEPDGYKIAKHIKEFIERDTELIMDYRNGKISYIILLKKRKELAGPKLINNTKEVKQNGIPKRTKKTARRF